MVSFDDTELADFLERYIIYLSKVAFLERNTDKKDFIKKFHSTSEFWECETDADYRISYYLNKDTFDAEYEAAKSAMQNMSYEDDALIVCSPETIEELLRDGYVLDMQGFTGEIYHADAFDIRAVLLIEHEFPRSVPFFVKLKESGRIVIAFGVSDDKTFSSIFISDSQYTQWFENYCLKKDMPYSAETIPFN